MATHSSTLAWKIPWMEEPGGLQSMGSLQVGHDWVTELNWTEAIVAHTYKFDIFHKDFLVISWRRQWHPTPVLLNGKIPWMEGLVRLQSMGSLRVRHDWATSLSLFTSCIGEGNGNPLQCSCLENPREGGAWWAAIYGVTQSQTQLKWLSSSSSSRLVHVIIFCLI